MSDIVIKGLAELQRALDTLPARIEANIMRGALRAGAKVLAAEAKQNIHNISGNLALSVRYGCKVSKVEGKVTAYVRAGGKGQPGWYAHMVEKGTAAHWIRVKMEARPSRMTRRGEKAYSIATLNRMAKRGSLMIGGRFIGASVAHPGARKKPFLRPALDMRGQAAVERMREYIRTRLSNKYGLDVPAPIDPQAEPDE